MDKKQATLFGGTGLIGGFLLDLILADDTFTKVNVITRKASREATRKNGGFSN